MSLLALLASGGLPGPVDPPDPQPPPDGETYSMPTASPWNAPDYLNTPTYDGSGSTVHPDVIDFAQLGVPDGRWNGYRYWMIHTPFHNNDESLENPSVLVSDQAATGWAVPDGVRDPLWFRPGPGTWNNDVDWVYDPDADELVLIYKPHSALAVARSSDGVTWPTTATQVSTEKPVGDPQRGLTGASPSLVRVSATDWRIWAVADSQIWVTQTTDPSLTTGWSVSTVCSFPGMIGTPWHLDVIRLDGIFYAFIYNRSTTNQDSGTGAGLTTATSTDGVTWSVGNPDPLFVQGDSTPFASRPTGWADHPNYFIWDRYNLYRPTLQPHENGTHFRVWYSARGDSSWRVGYLRLPMSLWPSPPA